jgi:hypothetical protein
MNGIDDKIDDDLCELDSVAEHRRRGRLKIQPERNMVVQHLAFHERDDVCDNVVQGENGVGRVALPCQGAKAGDDFAGPSAVGDRPLDGLAHLFEVGLVPQQPAQAGLAIRHDRRERLVDLMRNRRGQFAQGADARDVFELATRVMQRVLRLLLHRDVAVGFHRGNRTPALIALHRPSAHEPYFTAIASRVNEFSLPTAWVVGLLRRSGRRRILCLQKRTGLLSQCLLSWPAVELLRPRIPEGDDIVSVAHENRIVGQVEKRRLRAQVFRRSPVPERGESRNANRAKADQGAENRLALKGIAVHDGVAQKRLQHADGANQKDATLTKEICRPNHNDGIEHGDLDIERRERVDRENGGHASKHQGDPEAGRPA